MRTRPPSSDRSQAFTLEGLTASIVVLTAVLFAIQSLVVTPTTGGGTDPGVRSELQRQATDVLRLTAHNDTFDLSDTIRYWDRTEQTFVGAVNPRIGYGNRRPPKQFGFLLHNTFTARDRIYNVELQYRRKNLSNGTASYPMVRRGTPSYSAVSASYVVTLYDNMTLVGPEHRNVELWEYDTNATDNDDGYYPVPNAVPGPIYNVVEVRITVW
jgi:hypothetical protein